MGTDVKNVENETKGKYKVPAVETSFRILQLLSRKKYKESTLSEISKVLSLIPTSCFRLLQQLKDLSIVRYDDLSKRYALGPYLVVLGERAKESLDYISICLRYMDQITKTTGLTSVLVNLVEDDRLIHVAKVEGEEFGLKVSIGRSFSFFNSSYGACFLAYMDEETRMDHLNNNNDLTKQERLLFLKECEQIRTQGFALYFGEKQFAGIFGLAAPIFTQGGKMEMCVAVVGLSAQFNKDELSNGLGSLITQTSNSITNELTKK